MQCGIADSTSVEGAELGSAEVYAAGMHAGEPALACQVAGVAAAAAAEVSSPAQHSAHAAAAAVGVVGGPVSAVGAVSSPRRSHGNASAALLVSGCAGHLRSEQHRSPLSSAGVATRCLIVLAVTCCDSHI